MFPRLLRLLVITLSAGSIAIAAVRRDSVDRRATAVIDEIAKRPESRVPSIAPPRSIHEPQRVLPKRRVASGSAEVTPSLPRISAGAAASYTGFLGLLDNFNAIPPDTTGAVGTQHVVTMLNTQVNIQSKSGAARTNYPITLDAFWSPLATTGAFDPRIEYDTAADRWIASAGAGAETSSSALLVAVSQSGDPGGAWNYFKVTLGPSNWGDYPVLGFNGNWVVVSVNLFRMGTETYAGTALHVFGKADLYRGGSGAHITISNNQGELIPARDFDNHPDVFYFVQSFSGQTPGYRLSKLQGQPGQESFVGVGSGIVSINDAWADSSTGDDLAPQLGSTRNIDAGDSRLQNCVLRGGSIWCTHTVFLPAQNPTRTAIQWVQLDPVGPLLLQRGRIDDPSGTALYAFPSISVNRNNDALIGFTRFSAGDYASAGFALRTASDQPNSFSSDVVFKRGEASYAKSSWATTSNRWGDYSVTLVDPSDDLTFWTLQEFAGTPPTGLGGRFGTWWAKVPPPSTTSNCSYTLTTTQQTVGAAAANLSAAVNAAGGCPWMAASNSPWIQVTSGSPGAGNGTVTYTLTANPDPNNARTGTMTIAGKTFTVTQLPSSAGVDLAMTGLNAPTASQPGQQIKLAAMIANLSVSGAGAFRVGFYLGVGPSITTGDVLVASCPIPGLAGGGTTTCTGTVTLSGNLQPGRYIVGAIADDQAQIADPARANNVRVSDLGALTITAAVVRPAFPAQGVVNAASYQGAGIAPGEVVTIFGTNLGPAAAQFPAVTGGVVETLAGGTRVLFDGIAAPMIYSTAGQVSAVAPFALQGRSTSQVQVEYLGVRSDAVSTPVVAAAPAIFTLDRSGRGAGAILNQDLSLNKAANPATRGSTIVIYATGGGAMIGAADGRVAQPPYAALPTEVSVRIGGAAAQVTYAGAAPGLVAGVLQINAVVPPAAGSGAAVSVDVTIAGATTQAGVTIAVQ